MFLSESLFYFVQPNVVKGFCTFCSSLKFLQVMNYTTCSTATMHETNTETQLPIFVDSSRSFCSDSSFNGYVSDSTLVSKLRRSS